MNTPRKLEEYGRVPLTADELRSLQDIPKDLLHKIRDWCERQIIFAMLTCDADLSERKRGKWEGFMYAFHLLEELSKDLESDESLPRLEDEILFRGGRTMTGSASSGSYG